MPCVAGLPPIPMRCCASLQSSLKEGEGDRVGRTEPPRAMSIDPRGSGGLAEGQGLLSVLRDGSPGGHSGQRPGEEKGKGIANPFTFSPAGCTERGYSTKSTAVGGFIEAGGIFALLGRQMWSARAAGEAPAGTEARNRPVQPRASTAHEPANTSGS